MKFQKSRIKRLKKDFQYIAFDMMRQGRLPESNLVRDRRIRGWFGVSLKTIAKVWDLLGRGFDRLPEGATKRRLLWSLLLLKQYGTEESHAAQVGGVDEHTFSSWAWYFLEEVSYLESIVVSFHALLHAFNFSILILIFHRFSGKIALRMTLEMIALFQSMGQIVQS